MQYSATQSTTIDRGGWGIVHGSVVRIAAVVALVSAGFLLLHLFGASLSYFHDTEGSSANVLASSLLTIDAEGGGTADLSCSDHESFLVDVELGASRSSTYQAMSLVASGSDMALCDRLEVDAWLDGERMYGGPLGEMQSAATGTSGEWEFYFVLGSMPDDEAVPEGSVCTFDVVFEAYCPMIGYQHGGFTDSDAVRFVVAKNSCEGEGCPCVSCGDLYVDIVNVAESSDTTVVDSSSNTGGNTIISTGGESTNTIVTSDSTSVVTVTSGDSVNEVTVDAACDCCECEDGCEEPCGDTDETVVSVHEEQVSETTVVVETGDDAGTSDDEGAAEESEEASEDEGVSGTRGVEDVDAYIQDRLDEMNARL